MGEVIVITSGKGGVGKTTTTANIGTALAAIGKSVVLVDGDTGLRNLDILMGLENRVVYNLVDVIEEKCSLKQALIKDKRHERLFLLPTAQTKNKNDVQPKKMLNLINKLKDEFDYVLIDSPAGIEQGFENSVIAADSALVVVNPEMTSIRDADRVIGMLKGMGVKDHKLIINRIDYEMVKSGDMLDVEDIVSNLGIELIGIIPSDKAITVSTNRGEPIALNENSKIGKIFKEIAMRIIGEDVSFDEYGKSDNGFVDAIKKLFAYK
ncbi:septum site-determining protein MinD [Clostridium tagluense]|uniref:septum site-determining protein MinD n=1 Tax=Clostridium tagluense TaxID=360422 RepID=UPI001CF5099E|nr:septum site-determining protein MinD [Clostridium tagluense]MCB2296456.1 septum site-determining protein MinD [Clostridium tagluense]